jgi:hypothetical protein
MSKAQSVMEMVKHIMWPQSPRVAVSEFDDPTLDKIAELEKTFGGAINQNDRDNPIKPVDIDVAESKKMNEWFAGKEEFIYFEQLAQKQVKIFHDSADQGILLSADANDPIRVTARKNIVELMKLHGYKLEKYSYGSLTKLFIPIELDGDLVAGTALTVAFNSMKGKVWLAINIEQKTVSKAIAKSQYGFDISNESVTEDPFDISMIESVKQAGSFRKMQLQVRVGSTDGKAITDEQLAVIVEKMSELKFDGFRAEIITQIKG